MPIEYQKQWQHAMTMIKWNAADYFARHAVLLTGCESLAAGWQLDSVQLAFEMRTTKHGKYMLTYITGNVA